MPSRIVPPAVLALWIVHDALWVFHEKLYGILQRPFPHRATMRLVEQPLGRLEELLNTSSCLGKVLDLLVKVVGQDGG